ncbi:MAG: ATP-binding protein [Chloroflexota bacterium]
MDPWAVAFAVAVVVAIVAVVEIGRTRDRLRRALIEAEQRRASFEVARAERRQSRDALADQLDDGLLDVDATLHIRRANPAAHRLLGRPVNGLAGRSVIEAFLDADAETITAKAIADGAGVGEVRSARADGRALSIQARRTPGGGATLVLRDVSELRRLQRIRTEFIDNLSHELRTPVTTVSLLAETLTREAAALGETLPARMRDRIGKIEVETGHLVQMVSELLDLSRIESGTSLGPLDDVDLGRLVHDTAERLRLHADRQGIAIDVNVPAPLPPVRGDPDRLGQVLINLIHNSIKFSPDGGDVAISVRQDGSTLVVSVADQGVGIPRAAQERVFERFYKVDRARVRGEAGGTGLGLAIARHVIEQHGGRIWVESAEGSGSTFSFSLPI